MHNGCNNCYSVPPNKDVRIPLDDRYSSSESLQNHLQNQSRAVRIDEFCRIMFPLGFIIFNVCYWNYYQETDIEESSS